MAHKGGGGFVQATGLLHILSRIIFPVIRKSSTLSGVLKQQWINGHGSVQAVNGDCCIHICTH